MKLITQDLSKSYIIYYTVTINLGINVHELLAEINSEINILYYINVRN